MDRESEGGRGGATTLDDATLRWWSAAVPRRVTLHRAHCTFAPSALLCAARLFGTVLVASKSRGQATAGSCCVDKKGGGWPMAVTARGWEHGELWACGL